MKELYVILFTVALFLSGAYLVITNTNLLTFIGVFILIWSNNISTSMSLKNRETYNASHKNSTAA